MWKTTILLGVILTAAGIISYFGSGMVSITALIPAFIGVPLIILGILASKESNRKAAMHIAMILGLVGFAGTLPGVIKLFGYFGGSDLARPEAVGVQTGMSVLCLIYLVLGIKSFIDARRKRA